MPILRVLAATAVFACLFALPSRANPPPVGATTEVGQIRQVLYCNAKGDALALARAFLRDMTEGAIAFQGHEKMRACGKISTLIAANIVDVMDMGIASSGEFHLWVIEIRDPGGVMPNVWLIYGEGVAAAPTSLTQIPGREA